MSQRRSYLLPGILIALLFLLPAAAAAAGGAYITGTADDAREYKQLCIRTVDALDPLDVDCTLVTLGSTETGDLDELEYPLFGDIVREFDPASGTYHGVHVTANEPVKTVDGRTIPCEYRVYVKRTIPSFTVDVPGKSGNVLLVKVPENLPEGANFTELFRAASKEGYLFKSDAIIYMNQTGFTAYGAIHSSDYSESDLAYTLNHNEVSLTGFTTDSSLARNMMDARPYTRPTAGEYLIAAVKYDGAADTMHVLAAMPVIVLDGNQAVTWSGDNPYYQNQNKNVTVSFSGTDKVAYVLVKEETRYGLSMRVDTAKLAEEPIPVSTADLVEVLRTIAGEASPVAYTLTCDGAPVDVDVHSGFVITEGYGCSGYADASSVTIAAATLKTLNPGTYSLYALGLNDDRVIAIDQKSITIAAVAPTPTPTGGGGGGGGGGGAFFPPEPPIVYNETGNLNTDSEGIVGRPVEIDAEDGVGSLYVPSGVKALDRNGRPLLDISIKPVAEEKMPGTPAGAVFQFAGYAYEVSPEGATFDPSITLYIEIPEDVWNTLDLTDQRLTVKWYNQSANAWEDIPTTVSPSTRTVRATITHFSTFALFTEPVTTAAPTGTATATVTGTAATPTGETPAEGLPITMIIFAVIVVVIVAAAVYLFIVRRE
ncbi:hypothetical protein [Methanoculleus sp.]|uniref:hypothetical protein n=1 Tax=Methanoculleus sp. TaxID=90427 RepID=UPI001BD34493|nr:hypothetical protein [Methanoculleus sp.]